MADPFPTFDESWHRIAPRQIRLRPGVAVTRQLFRGKRWYVLKDPFSNQFFRLRPPAYDFICRLEAKRSVEEAWEDSLKAHPDDAPGQGEVVHLLSQLYRLNLLRSDLPGDSEELFDRLRKREHKEAVQKWTNVLFLKIPIWNPDSFLVRTLPAIGWAISRLGFAIWIGAMIFAAKLLFDNWQSFADQSQSLLSKGNLPWLYLGLIVTKLVHEFGHGYFCRKFGGEVPIMGIMLLIFNPLPYVDASSAWSFRERRKRILVAAAGMIVELFLAAIAVVVWANTGEGPVHSVAHNMIFIASVATLLFNLNPLLRFDGYHILSDLLDTPNLQGRATSMMKYWIDRYLFGLENATRPTDSRREKFWLTVFFVASFVYRIFLFTGIILFIANRFLVLGVLLAILGGIVWGIVPIYKAIHHLLFSPKLARKRARAVGVSVAIVGVIIAFLCLVPMPSHFRAPGVLRATEYQELHAGATGVLDEIVVRSGKRVKKGDVLVEFTNPELIDQLRVAAAERAAAELQIRKAKESNLALSVALQEFVKAVDEQIIQLREERDALTIVAPHDGRWIAPKLNERAGTWLPKGMPIGQVIDTTGHYFSIVIPQSDVSRLFTDDVENSEVKLYGQESRTLPVSDWDVIPADRALLPSASLGLYGGGDVAVASQDGSGRQAVEPFFEVRAQVPDLEAFSYQHGNNGRARFEVPAEPLMFQWARRVRQLLQKRYQV